MTTLRVDESDQEEIGYPRKKFWKEFLTIMGSVVIMAAICALLGSLLSLWQMNQPLAHTGNEYLTFEVESRNILELSGESVRVEISSRNDFSLLGPTTVTPQTVKPPLAARNPDLNKQMYFVFDGTLPPGTYHVVSPDYWSLNQGIQFEMWAPSSIVVNLSRTDYNSPFGQDSRTNGGLLGLVGGMILGFCCGFYLVNKMSIQ